MNDTQPTIAVIGCGYWGKNLVRNFANLGELRMVHDASDNNAREMSKKFDVPAVDMNTILSDDAVRGVAIAAPAPLHFDLAALCLNAGKHVMVEKPVALTKQDAVGLIDLAKEQDKLLMVGHLLNYHNGFLKVCELVQEGAVGKLRRIYSNRLSFGKVRTEEDVLWSFAPHDISMILRLMNGESPETVNAFGGNYVSDGIADFSHIHMGFDRGITAHVFVSWLHPFKEQKLVVVGDEGMLVFDDTAHTEEKVAFYGHSVAMETGSPVLTKTDAKFIPIDVSEPLRSECAAFVSGMDDLKSVHTDGHEGLRVLEVLTRAQNAMANNQGVGNVN